MLLILEILVALVILGVLVVGLYISMQGDAVMRLLTKKRSAVALEKKEAERVDFSLEIPFDNVGKRRAQCSMLICVFICRRSNITMYCCVAR